MPTLYMNRVLSFSQAIVEIGSTIGLGSNYFFSVISSPIEISWIAHVWKGVRDAICRKASFE